MVLMVCNDDDDDNDYKWEGVEGFVEEIRMVIVVQS